MANEMRMIDANWLKGIIRQYMKDHPGCQIFDTVMGLVCDMLNDSPTVDAVPVVRCRECKYSYGNKYCTNDAWKDEGNTVYIEPDAFCSYGERKNNE